MLFIMAKLPQSGWAYTVKRGATTIHEDSAAYTVSTSSLTMETEAVTHAVRWVVSRGDIESDHTCHHTHRFNELATKSEEWNGKPRLECVDGRHPSSETPVSVLPWTSRRREWRKMTEQIYTCRLAGKATFTSGLRLWNWSVEELEALHADTKPRTSHHRSPESVEKGSYRRSSLKGRERAIVNQRNIGTVSKAKLGKLIRDGVERIPAFPSA